MLQIFQLCNLALKIFGAHNMKVIKHDSNGLANIIIQNLSKFQKLNLFIKLFKSKQPSIKALIL